MNDGYAKSKLYGELSDKQVAAEDIPKICEVDCVFVSDEFYLLPKNHHFTPEM